MGEISVLGLGNVQQIRPDEVDCVFSEAIEIPNACCLADIHSYTLGRWSDQARRGVIFEPLDKPQLCFLILSRSLAADKSGRSIVVDCYDMQGPQRDTTIAQPKLAA